MRVIQLIDSLEPGGSERVAVNFANALSKQLQESFLCATRQEGPLKNQINKEVEYLFLAKKHTLDINAILNLLKFIRRHNIEIIHAHSSSFFLAVLIKLLNTKLKVVWHDHYGKSEFLNDRPKKLLKWSSLLFSHIFTVNDNLKQWAQSNLRCNKVTYIKNFPVNDYRSKTHTELNGESGKRLLCLANLREQKNHQLLISAFHEVVTLHPSWTLHLVGKDFNDAYSNEIKQLIKSLELENKVFIYGSKEDTFGIIERSTFGVLASKSEGLPMSLLEYGLLGLPTIATNVGDCGEVIIDEHHGLLIESENVNELVKAILYYIDNPKIAKDSGKVLQSKVMQDFSADAVTEQIIKLYLGL